MKNTKFLGLVFFLFFFFTAIYPKLRLAPGCRDLTQIIHLPGNTKNNFPVAILTRSRAAGTTYPVTPRCKQ